MERVAFYLLYMASLLLGGATIAEEIYGTETVRLTIFSTLWFRLFWMFIFIASTTVVIRRKLYRYTLKCALHLSFSLIFIGAITSSFTSHKGSVHLLTGQPTNTYYTSKDAIRILPFTLQLDSFVVEYYPGTKAASDYVSYVTCHTDSTTQHVRISMNQILDFKGYRFYQASFDNNNEGSWLTINYDPWGTPLVYLGFLLFILSALFLLLHPRSKFLRLLQHPLLRKSGLFIFVLFYCPSIVEASLLPVIKQSQADSIGRKAVVYNDRIAPFNTQALDFLKKVYGKTSYHGLTPEQVICSWNLHPEDWNKAPIIHIKNKALRHHLHLSDRYVSLHDLFDGNEYRLLPLWEQIKDKNGRLGKSIREVDEKVGLILMLNEGKLIKETPNNIVLSKKKIHAEWIYNHIPFIKILFMTCLTLGILSVSYMMYRMLHNGKNNAWLTNTERILLVGIWLLHSLGYGLRWYISGTFPLSNGYETMEFCALIVLFTALLLQRNFAFVRPFSFLISGFILLVAYIGGMNPQITPLMPVLSSPLLSWHVSLIMISYALFALITCNSILALWIIIRPSSTEQYERISQLTLLNRLLLYPSTFLLGIGILLGSIWANVSWGSYWSWDPKEVWALITFLIYGMAFHYRSLPFFNKKLCFHCYLLFAFLSVLMTYFGVNYLLGGMHSYG